MNDSTPPETRRIPKPQSLLHLQVPREANSVGIIASLIAPIVEVDAHLLETRLLAGPTYVGPFDGDDVESVAHALRCFGALVQVVEVPAPLR